MKLWKRKKFNEQLDEEIISLTGKLSTLDPSDASYGIVAENLIKLYESKSKEKDKRKFDWGPVITVGGYLTGIVLIAALEKEIIMPQRLLGLLPKGRV